MLTVCPGSPPANYAKRTQTQFRLDSVYTELAVHLRELPQEEKVFRDGGQLAGRTAYGYDETTRHPAGGISQHDATVSDKRGNVTTLTRQVLESGATVSTQYAYDIAGNIVQVTDPKNHVTSYSFADQFTTTTTLGGQQSYAFPTQVTWQSAPGGPRSVNLKYNYYVGSVSEYTDVNGTRTEYALKAGDALDRPGSVIRAANEPALRWTTAYEYDDTPGALNVTARDDQFQEADQRIVARTHYDGFGRVVRNSSGLTDIIHVDHEYDGIGRLRRKANPYRSGDTASWTTNHYDALGRTIGVENPDGTSITTAYWGITTTVTDEAGRSRQLTHDALGRLTQVLEAGIVTGYQYNALDKLTDVTQPSVDSRSFTYDMLGQLRMATNPETGLVAYDYDNNGNLLTRTHAGVTTTYSYDALNRLTQKVYTGGIGSPVARLCYDGRTHDGVECTGQNVPGQLGRLTATGNSNSRTLYA